MQKRQHHKAVEARAFHFADYSRPATAEPLNFM